MSPGKSSRYMLGRITVELLKGDITEVEADAIVNAANRYLKHGGGVAGAIVMKGGYVIQRESDEYVRRHGPLPVGGVAVTSAGRLRAKYVIHAVGPVYGDPQGDEKLADAIRNSLSKAEELGLRSIALPAISTGVYGYPLKRCAEIMVDVIKEFSEKAESIKKVLVVLYGDKAYNEFLRVFEEKLGKT